MREFLLFGFCFVLVGGFFFSLFVWGGLVGWLVCLFLSGFGLPCEKMKLLIFSPLSMERIKVIHTESQRSVSVYWVLLPITLTWGCLWHSVPSQTED